MNEYERGKRVWQNGVMSWMKEDFSSCAASFFLPAVLIFTPSLY